MGAGSIPLAALIAACSKDGSGSSASTAAPVTLPPTTAAPATTAPIDPSKPWWLQANFAPVMDELEAFDLQVRGSLPRLSTGST